MGVSVSLAVDPDRDIPVRSCKSTKMLKRFPSQRQCVAGDLVLEFKAYPSELGRPEEETSAYWWVDCQFVPFDNTQLIVSAGAYTLRPNRQWVTCRGVRAGLITHWQLEQDRLACSVFKGTTTTAKPKAQLHPDGKYVGFVARGCVRIVDIHNRERYVKDDDYRAVSHKYCAFSPDGVFIAVLYRILRHFELEVLAMDTRLMRKSSVVCAEVCPFYKGSRSYTEDVECKFSPDSSLIALSHSDGILFTLYRKNLILHQQIFPGILPDAFLANERSFDFEPTSGHSIIAGGCKCGVLYICDIDSCRVVHEEIIHESESIETLQYSPTGDYLAVGLSDCTIKLFSSKSRQTVLSIICPEKCPDIAIQPCTGHLPGIIRMSFDICEEHLAVSSTDGKVRIWQLPIKLNLRYMCKLKVLQYCSVVNIQHLPLPPSIIRFLKSPSSEC